MSPRSRAGARRTGWRKAPPIVGRMQGCLHAGLAVERIALRAVLAVGFGSVTLTRDEAIVWSGDEAFVDGRPKTVAWAERQAREDPKHDWRLRFHAPLSDRTYQRHDRNAWVLIAQGEGFA